MGQIVIDCMCSQLRVYSVRNFDLLETHLLNSRQRASCSRLLSLLTHWLLGSLLKDSD